MHTVTSDSPERRGRIEGVPKPRPPFRLTRYFSVASFFGVLAVLVILLFFYRHLALDALTDHETRGSVALAQVFANTIWPKHAAYVQGASAIPKAELAQRPEAALLRQDVLRQMAGLSVVKVKIYNLAGLTVFSTDPRQIGEDKSTNGGFVSAKAGGTATEIVFRDKFDAFEGVINDRNLVSSYIPIRKTGSLPVEGVMEVYSDVTDFITKLEQTQWQIVGGVLGSLSLLYLFLFAIIRRAAGVIRAQSAEVRQFAENVPAMAISLDENLRCRFANKGYCDFFGFEQSDIVGRHLREIVGEEAYREIEGHFVRVLQGHSVTYERTRKLQNGEFRYLEVKLLPHFGDQGRILGCFAVTGDITEHTLEEERIQRVAHHDSLTGLPNRLLFNDRLKQAISRAKRDSRQFALLFLDLDGFKPVNDTLGHAAGDELLKSVAARIRRQIRESDTVARVGGDEFTVILPDTAGRERAETVARKIIAAIAAPFQLGSQKQDVNIGTSIGVAFYPADAREADALVNAADAAMYRAKQEGNRCQFYAA